MERSEFALYQVHQDLLALRAEHAPDVELVPLLATVGSTHRMTEIMDTWRPHTVYHAAAYKHVPLVEHNPAEGLYKPVTRACRRPVSMCPPKMKWTPSSQARGAISR